MKAEQIRYFVKPFVHASFENTRGKVTKNNSRLVDISNKDCAFKCSEDIAFAKGEKGTLTLYLGNGSPDTIKDTTVVRNKDNCIALIFDVRDNSKYFDGPKINRISEISRKRRQRELAINDNTVLSNETRQIKDCQMKLFITCFAISIALASLLAPLYIWNYVSAVTMLIAIAPAGISAIFIMLSIQKALTLNRITSFNTVLKQQLINDNFGEKYLGWENSLNNHYSCKSMECDKIKQERCSTKANIKAKHSQKSIISQGQSFLFTFLIATGYISIFFTSLIVTIYFMTKAEVIGDLYLGIIATIFVMCLGGYIIFLGYQVQRGNHSFVKYFYLWKIMLDECEPFHPDRINPTT